MQAPLVPSAIDPVGVCFRPLAAFCETFLFSPVLVCVRVCVHVFVNDVPVRRLVCVAEMPDRGRSSKSALAKGRDWYLGWNCIRNPSAQYAADPSTPVRVAIGAERPCDMNPAMSI